MEAIRREASAVLIDRFGFDGDRLRRRQLDFPAGVQISSAFALERRIQIEVGDDRLVATVMTLLDCCGPFGEGRQCEMTDDSPEDDRHRAWAGSSTIALRAAQHGSLSKTRVVTATRVPR